MTSDENPADVIEVAAKIIYNNIGARPAARALHDAGLLADPADQDEPDWQAIADQAEQDMAHWVRECGDAERRAERAEDEVAALVAEGIRQKRRANDAIAERDELRATVERVRALADKWAGFGTHTWFRQIHVTAAESLHAALDGAGDAPNQQIGEQP